METRMQNRYLHWKLYFKLIEGLHERTKYVPLDHYYKTEKITSKTSDVAEYIELFGSSI